MGKEKSTMSCKSNRGPRKTFLFHAEEKHIKSKTGKKSINNLTKESCNEFDTDSLEYLRNPTERKKLNGVDEKIKLLKTELMTLLSDQTLEKTCNYSTELMNDSSNSDLQGLYNFNKLNPLILGSDLIDSKKNYEEFNCLQIKKENFKSLTLSTSSKFSKQLKEPLDTKIFVGTEEQIGPDAQSLSLKSKSQIGITEKFVHPSAEPECKIFNASSLPQQKVEQLLYKSFIMQNSKLLLYEGSGSEHREPATKPKKEKLLRFKRQSKNHNKKFTQKNLNKYCRSTQREKKRIIGSLQSEVEIVDLENSPYSNVKPRNDNVCIGSDMKDYDWNEPFDLDNNEFSLDLEISEEFEEKETAVNKKLKLTNTDQLETEINCCNDENEKTLLKRVWECPVCFEQSKGQEVVATLCGHIFCKMCLENHFSKLNKSCPSCRSNLKNKPFITLFNF